jgi:ATP-dependent helicase HrpA
VSPRKPPRAAATALAARQSEILAFRSTDLPIGAAREEILDHLARHQLFLVAGETGSGKSTQLPQYCMQAGRGIAGVIAHTQPRRLAARALAARIAEEVSQPVGKSIGYKVRFADQVSESTRVQLMTDGLLLAELAADPSLSRYDTIIVDEAHERSLNVDLLLGVLKGLLVKRRELKVIITSATLDIERVADFFGGAPIVRVSGRSYPVEVRYRDPGEQAEEVDLPSAVLGAFEEIASEPGQIGDGDVLVFLPGEREIRDVGEVLERELKSRVDILPLYSRLAWDQQSKIFQRGARRRVVLATNVAETSVTVPGIRAVIDTGLARISRYSARNRLQRLPIEPISRASAEQRKGRCGRVGTGLCLRLFSEQDFAERPAFTEPEVLRTNLAALLLRLAADRLGSAEQFPFIDPPDARALNDGYRLLQELQALDSERGITRLGRAMARLPIDPRLSRALLESKRFRCEAELLAIAAGLSVQDVHILQHAGTRPPDAEDTAPALEDGRSEFNAMLHLWRAYRRAREGTRRELRAWCKERQLSLLRLSEWDDVYAQLCERARDLGIVAKGYTGSYAGIHRALLAGFCSMVGQRNEEGVYLGTRGVRFHLLPGSLLGKRKPRWVMAANVIETSRVFARRVAQIEVHWIETAAAHLVKREHVQPDWDEERESVVARERVSFLGLILSANRIVNYGPVAPEESRRIFAREALVHGRLQRRPEWVAANDALVAQAAHTEERLRRRDLLLGAESLVDFYDRALPRQVSSAATLEHFSRHMTAQQRESLRMQPGDIMVRAPDPEALAQFPEVTQLDSLSIPVDYRFVPGEAQDGATLQVPLLALPQLTRSAVRAAVPGLALPRIESLLRSLPKEARRRLIPIPDTARRFLETNTTGADLTDLRGWLKGQGVEEALLKFDSSALPVHLTPQLAVINRGREIARGADLAELRRQCATAARAELALAGRLLFPEGEWRSFVLEELPRTVTVATERGELTLHGTLARQESGLRVALEWSQQEAELGWRDGSVRLARVLLASQARDLGRSLGASTALLLRASSYFNGADLEDVLLQWAFRSACFEEADAPRSRAAFEAAVQDGRSRLYPAFDAAVAQLQGYLTEAAAVSAALESLRGHALDEAARESRAHLAQLLSGATLRNAAASWLRQIPRYLKAEQRRWQRGAERGTESPGVLDTCGAWALRLQGLANQLSAEARSSAQLIELRFWVEELRVSLYAQELKTLGQVSAARLEQRAAEIEQWLKR